MKHLTKILSVLFATLILALCLAACNTTESRNPAEDSVVLDENPMTLRALVKVIDSRRSEYLKDDDYHKKFREDYEAKYQQYYSSISPEEALELVTIRERKDSVPYQQAVDDADLFFRMLRYRLGRYAFLGGDEVFYKARDAVMDKLSAYKGKTVSTSDLASMIASELKFIDDTHFLVDGISPFYDFNIETKKYQTYLSGLTFKADENGCYIDKETEKLYFVSCDNENTSVVPMLNNQGELVYSLILYCPPAEKPGTSVVTFKSDGEITKKVMWNETAGTYISNGLVYSETDSLAYIGLTGCGNEVEWKLEEIGYNASKKDVVILDLRGNGGTHANDFLSGYMQYPLTIDEVVMIRVGLTNSNYIKPGQEYTKFLEFSNEWKIRKSEPLIVVLVDNNTGCAPEDFTRYFRFISNSVVIGTSTMGQLDGGIGSFGNWDKSKYDTVYLHLPNTGMEVCCSTSISLYGDYESFVGKGFKPDLYVADTSKSLDYTLKLLVNEGYITNDDVKELDIYDLESMEKEEADYDTSEFDIDKAVEVVEYDSPYGKYYEARKTLTMEDNEMHFIWPKPDTTKKYCIEIMSSGPESVSGNTSFYPYKGALYGADFQGGSVVINASVSFINQPAYGIVYKQGEFFNPFEVIFRFFPIENNNYNWIHMDIPVGDTRPVVILAEEGKISRVYEDNGYDGPYEDWPDNPY